jgi:tripartite-type tricarboxylate transporter receptor subunit TctC
VADPAVKKRLLDMGLEPTGQGPEVLAAALKADYERWGPVIKASGFKGD